MQELYEAAKELLTQPQVTTWGRLKKATEEFEKQMRDTPPTALQLWIQHPTGKAQVRISSPYNNPEVAEIFWYLDYHLQQKAKAESWELQCTAETSKAILEYEQNIKCPKLVTNKAKEPLWKGLISKVESRCQDNYLLAQLENGYQFHVHKDWPILPSIAKEAAVWVSSRSAAIITRVDIGNKTVFDHHAGQEAALAERYNRQIQELEAKLKTISEA